MQSLYFVLAAVHIVALVVTGILVAPLPQGVEVVPGPLDVGVAGIPEAREQVLVRGRPRGTTKPQRRKRERATWKAA
jgi:hypothetical protein